MELYIMRHGETVWNLEGKLQGNSDIGLNENGRELSGRIGERIRGIPFDRIYSSPLIRAYETACLLRGCRNIPIIRDDRLRELSFGVYEGRVITEMMEEDGNTFRYFFSQPQLYRAPEQGETLEHACARAARFLEEAIEPLARTSVERVLIVAHGAINQALMCHICGRGIADYWESGLSENCGFHIVRLDETGYHVMEEGKTFI